MEDQVKYVTQMPLGIPHEQLILYGQNGTRIVLMAFFKAFMMHFLKFKQIHGYCIRLKSVTFLISIPNTFWILAWF